jgi:hypothetical protein
MVAEGPIVTDLVLISLVTLEATAAALLAFIIFRRFRIFQNRFMIQTAVPAPAGYRGTAVPNELVQASPVQAEVENIVKYGLSRLPPTFRLPDEIAVEIVPHAALNERVRQSGVPAVLFGFSTEKGRRIVLSDVIFQLSREDRNRHILHEVWHIGQLASDYHPGLEKSEFDAWAFAERHKHLS